MNKALFVINPVSGGLNKDSVIDLIRSKYNKNQLRIFQTTGENDEEKIKEILQQDKFETIVAGGGDGTITLVSHVIDHKDINLGILPLGSANGLARELEIPENIEGALNTIQNGNAHPFDTIIINEKWRVLHMADFGMNATLVKRYHHDDHRGFIGYALSALKEISNLLAENEFELSLDDGKHLISSSFVVIANAQRYGTGIIINPEGKTDDGKFEICCLKKISFENYLEKFRNEEELEFNPFETFSVQNAHIHLKKKTDFQIDGEYIGQVKDLHIHTKPNTLKIIY